jgi:hypothetical protein
MAIMNPSSTSRYTAREELHFPESFTTTPMTIGVSKTEQTDLRPGCYHYAFIMKLHFKILEIIPFRLKTL